MIYISSVKHFKYDFVIVQFAMQRINLPNCYDLIV